MTKPAKQLLTTAALILSAASHLFSLGCDSSQSCANAFGKPSAQRACRRGAEEIAPAAHGNIRLADAECVKIYERAEIPLGDADAGTTLYNPDADVRDLYNACHYGATGYMVAVEGQDAGKVQAAGCVQSTTASAAHCY